MIGGPRYPRRPRHSPSRRSAKRLHRVLRNEWLEPRMVLSGSSLSLLATTLCSSNATASVHAPVNAPPIVAQSISINGNLAVTGKTAALSVLGSDDGGESKLVYTWSVTALPPGGTATFNVNGSNAAKYATATFTKAGSYTFTVKIVDSGGLSVSSAKTVVVSPTLASINVSTSNSQLVGPNSTLAVSGVSQAFVAQGLDQFGNALATPPAYTWSITTVPSGASTPKLVASGAGVTETFSMAGGYGLTVQAKAAGVTVARNVSMTVSQTLTSIVVSPNTAGVRQGATQQFTPQALDQFHQTMANRQLFTWSATAGSVTSTGLFTAPSSGTSCTVTAKSGSVSGMATVTLLVNTGNLQDPALATLVQGLDADGSISRQDMIQILRSVSADGTLRSMDFSDLKTILSEAKTLNIPDYVDVLAGDVINGNAANATYQGQPLGNLAVGSSATQLNDLIGKWFLGTDTPALCDTLAGLQIGRRLAVPANAVAHRRIPGRTGRLLLHFRAGHAGRQQSGRDPKHVYRQRRRHVHGPLLHRHVRHHLQLQQRQHQRRLHEQRWNGRLRDRQPHVADDRRRHAGLCRLRRELCQTP